MQRISCQSYVSISIYILNSKNSRTGYGCEEKDTKKKSKTIELMAHSNANATNSTSGRDQMTVNCTAF